MSKNKKGVAINTPRIIVNGANDPTRGKVNLYGNGLRHHGNWYWSEMAYVHQQHASTTPIQIAGTDKDIIISSLPGKKLCLENYLKRCKFTSLWFPSTIH